MKKLIILTILVSGLLLTACSLPTNNQTASTSRSVNNEVKLSKKLAEGKWINAYEEKKDGVIVYRNDLDYKPSPARFRDYFIYQGDDNCICLMLSPVDRHYEEACPCSLAKSDDEMIFKLGTSQYTVIEMTDKLLRLKSIPLSSPVMSPDCGKDTKTCLDGTVIVRSSQPSCDFAPCPGENNDGLVCCESFGYGSGMKKCCESYKMTEPDKCIHFNNIDGGGKRIVEDNLCK